ncbi:MAG: NfeD family protein [Halanaerobiales bacterium]
MQKKLYIISIIFIILLIISSTTYSADLKNRENTELIYNIPIDSDIDPGMATFIDRRIKTAEEADADLIIITIDTYGGLVDSAIQIRDKIFNTYIPTITFISHRAWSAGALIALSGEELVMVPGSSIGAAETRPNEEKYISALRTEFNSTAERRGKDGEIAEAMVDADIEIEGLVEKGKLLSMTASEAEKYKISDTTADDFNDLLRKLKSENAEIVKVTRSPAEILANVITNPVFSVLLLTIGFMALWAEALIPGWGIGGTTGVLSLSLFFSGYMINGYGNWGLLALFVAGILLIGLEVFVIPGFGVTGVGGLIAIFTSLYFFMPSTETALLILVSALLFSLIGAFILFKFFGSSRFWQNIALGESQNNETGYTAHINKKELKGGIGETLTPLRPAGTALINDKRIDVVSEGGFIEKGAKIKVVDVSGSRIIVKKIEREDF